LSAKTVCQIDGQILSNRVDPRNGRDFPDSIDKMALLFAPVDRVLSHPNCARTALSRLEIALQESPDFLPGIIIELGVGSNAPPLEKLPTVDRYVARKLHFKLSQVHPLEF